MDRSMETVEEEVEEYSWREVLLPRLIPVVSDAAPELERETGERRRGRELLVAVDFGPNSKHAFDWALVHFARMADTLHLVHAVSSVNNDLVYEKSQELMEDLAIEALKTSLVRTKARIVEGDAGKVICREAERLKPAAVILGTRGRGLIQREVSVNIASTTVKQPQLSLFQAKKLVNSLCFKGRKNEDRLQMMVQHKVTCKLDSQNQLLTLY
uniref:UspA domain-containing protein n=1 Tax=Oryza nivara TaxID=4536 RepID=A0A0E0GBW0_ORYNI